MPKGERRAYTFEMRAEDVEGIARVEGRAILYNSRTNIGRFDEIIEPGALDNTDLRDVPLFANHNTNSIPLARSRRNNDNSTMQLTLDEEGLGIRADLDIENNAEARALYSAIERGDITGMSFMMIGVKDKWEGARSEHPLRHIVGIERIGEVSIVNFPAYAQSSIESRDNSGALESAMESLESAIAEEEEEERANLAAERRTAALERLNNLIEEVSKND